MSAVYKHITTRPTLDDIFWPEVWRNTRPLVPSITAPVVDNSTVISVTEEEAITWGEIASRIDEIRPDLKVWLLSKTNELISTPDDMVFFDPTNTVIDNFVTNPEFSGTRPNYNPFSLTFTTIHTFSSIEVLTEHYNLLSAELSEIAALAVSQGSTITEEFYNNGILINKSDLALV
jgi:hypothetical protein